MTMRKLLRIFHVSDVHFGLNPAPPRRMHLASALTRLGLAKQKLAGHDGGAFAGLHITLSRVLKADTGWPETLMVCTGDLSTMGDEPSVRAAMTRLIGTCTRLGLPRPLFLYGNHDVWDGDIPFGSSQAQLDARRSRLRAAPPFDATGPLRLYTTSGTSPVVSIWSLNTILHERFLNTLALGKVKEDRYWENPTGPNQLHALPPVPQGEVRIVLTHHPVDGDAGPRYIRRLLNPSDVVMTLRKSASPPSRGCPATIVLSGHTHEVYPQVGQGLVAGATNKKLGCNQLQMIVGSLSQRALNSSSHEQSFQMIRLYLESPAQGSPGPKLVVERIVFFRTNKTSHFDTRVPFGAPGYAEVTSLEL